MTPWNYPMKSLKKESDNPFILNNHGLILQNLRRIKESIKYFDKAREIDPENIIFCINKAKSLIELKEYDQAEELLKKVLEHNENDLQVLDELARVYMYKNDLKKAEEILQKELNINKNDAYLQANYGEFYFLSGDYDKALENFQKSIAINPRNTHAYLRVSQIYYSKGEIDKAMKYLKTGINLSPNNKEMVKLAATVAFEQGNYYDAIKYYKNFLANAGFDNEILSNLAFIYEKLGFINFAIWGYNKALSIGGNINDKFNLAQLYYKVNKWDEAISLMKEILQEEPQELKFYIFLGKILIQKKEFAYAEAVIEMGQKIEPENYELLMLKGEVYLQQNQFKEALNYFKKAITKKPKDPRGYINITNLFLKLNQPKNAEFMLKQGLKFVGDDAELYFLLGDTVGHFPERFEEAVEYYNKAKDLNPQLGFTHLKLAKEFISMGELDKAFDEINKHLKDYENDVAGYELLGYIYIQNGLFKEALAAYEKILSLKGNQDKNAENILEILRDEIETRGL